MFASCGLIDTTGVRKMMLLTMRFKRSMKTGVVQYQFTIFKRHFRGLDRVYQLDITQWPKPVKDAHQRPHEHMGDMRILGAPSWAIWTYDQAVSHFCLRTNVTFDPPLGHPEELRLQGTKK